MASLLVEGRRLLRLYLRAWQTRDGSLLKEIFSADALYFVSPVRPPRRGLVGIQRYWREKVRPQSHLRVAVGAPRILDGQFVFVWRARFRLQRRNQTVHLDGVMFWDIRRGRIKRLVEFYHKELV